MLLLCRDHKLAGDGFQPFVHADQAEPAIASRPDIEADAQVTNR